MADFKRDANLAGQVLVSAQLGTAEAVVYAVITGQAVKVAHGTLCNITGSPVVVSVSVVQAGGTVGDGTHRVINSYSLGAGDTLSLRDYLAGAMLGPGDRIAAFAGTASAVDLVITGAVSS